MAQHPNVMISSTALDLPEHREKVKNACLRQSMFPVMMEPLPASDASSIAESLKMVDEAEIYFGVFGVRYGTIDDLPQFLLGCLSTEMMDEATQRPN